MALGAGETPQTRLPRLALSGAIGRQPQVLVQLRVEDGKNVQVVHYVISSYPCPFLRASLAAAPPEPPAPVPAPGAGQAPALA
jgi:hypothetical protein